MRSAVILSTTTGSVFCVLIVTTYIHVRRKATHQTRAGLAAPLDVSFRVTRSGSQDSDMPTKPIQSSNIRSMSYDRWLIARFLICFAISNVFQLSVIIWYVLSYRTTAAVLEQGEPDYSLESTLKYLAITMPGVASGLLIFFVFGTTAQFRSEYKRWLHPLRRKFQGREGPIMVAPLSPNNPSSTNNVEPSLPPTNAESGYTTNQEAGQRGSSNSTWQLPPFGFEEKPVSPIENDRNEGLRWENRDPEK